MTPVPSPAVPKSPRGVGVPPPDSPGGLAILGALILGVAFLLLLVGAYSALSAQALWIVTLNLVLGVVVAMFLVSMIGSDRARATAFELDFARTVQGHLAAGETLAEATPLGGILQGYAHAANEQRRSVREHLYAASTAVYSTALALLATLLVGLAYVGGDSSNLVGLGLIFELGALTLLALTAGLLALSVGRDADVVGIDAIVLRRWYRAATPSFPFMHSLREVPWAAEKLSAPTTFPWQETSTELLPPP